jgi:tetratricopeptide (TPR) repeat protein
VLPERHPERVATAFYLGRTLRHLGRYDDALAYYREAAEATRQQPRSAGYPCLIHRMIADALQAQGKFADAEPHLLDTAAAIGSKDKDPAEWGRTAEALTALYTAWGKPEKAAEWAQKK